MRARDRVYHVDCFRCVACRRRLVSGDEFAVRPTDGGLVCRQHFDHDAAALAAAVRRPSTAESRRAVDSSAAAAADCAMADRVSIDSDSSPTSAANMPLTTDNVVAGSVSDSVSVAKKKPNHTGSFYPPSFLYSAISRQFVFTLFLQRDVVCGIWPSVCLSVCHQVYLSCISLRGRCLQSTTAWLIIIAMHCLTRIYHI